MAIAFVMLVVVPTITKAETDELSGTGQSSTSIRAIPRNVGREMLNNLKIRQNNAKTNQELRNIKLEELASTTRMINGSSTRPRLGSTTPLRILERNASSTWSTSTVPFRNQNNDSTNDKCIGKPGQKCGFVENGNGMPINVFNIRKNTIINELQRALDNLRNIRDRVEVRIDKAASNTKNMTESKRLMVIANTKILDAQNAIDQLRTIRAHESTPSTTATSSINLDKPRLVAIDAQKAIKDAQRALNDVVVAIAKAMGLKLGNSFGDPYGHPEISTTTATTTP